MRVNHECSKLSLDFCFESDHPKELKEIYNFIFIKIGDILLGDYDGEMPPKVKYQNKDWVMKDYYKRIEKINYILNNILNINPIVSQIISIIFNINQGAKEMKKKSMKMSKMKINKKHPDEKQDMKMMKRVIKKSALKKPKKMKERSMSY